METSRNLYVGGLPVEGAGEDWAATSEAALRELLSPFGKVRGQSVIVTSKCLRSM
jgi:RNA recognition motif-containing protein